MRCGAGVQGCMWVSCVCVDDMGAEQENRVQGRVRGDFASCQG